MPTLEGSLIRHAAAAACLTLLLTPSAAAQEPIVAPQKPDFLSRYDFHLSAAALRIDDPRFSWDTHFGGDLDVVDYVVGRTSVLIDYEAVLGSQLRPFDPNQGNYTLEISSSLRVAGTEVAVIFHHVSRHLSDRPKTFPIAWNVLGARVLRHVALGSITIDADADAGAVPQHSRVDYAWVANADLVIRRPIAPRAGVYARGSGHLIGVDSTRLRHSQSGGAVEAGLRLIGGEGVAELFAGFERRIDADPLDFQPQQWLMVGFRLVRH
jgi:hypothetical protein